MSEKLDRMKDQKEKAEQKLRYYQHQEKMLEHWISRGLAQQVLWECA